MPKRYVKEERRIQLVNQLVISLENPDKLEEADAEGRKFRI